MGVNIDEFLRLLPQLIRENDTVKGAIISALSGVVATHEDVQELIREMDRRFESMQATMDQRFEAVDRRFESMQATMDQRFESMQATMDQRFEAVQTQMDQRFEETNANVGNVLQTVLDIRSQLGASFEQFARNVVVRVLEGEGFQGVELHRRRFSDPEHVVWPDTEDVEIDGYSDDPPVIVETTAILRNRDKVEAFLRKKSLVEQLTGTEFRGFFVASGCEVSSSELADLLTLLRPHQIELLNL